MQRKEYISTSAGWVTRSFPDSNVRFVVSRAGNDHPARPWFLVAFVLIAQAVHAGSFLTNAPMSTPRRAHTATLLTDGRVLIVGGDSDSAGYLASAELYDPATGGWQTTGSMTNIRAFHTATLLAVGKVLVAGGYGFGNLPTAQLYDSLTGAWTTTGSMNSARYQHTATLLPNGKVLVTGGLNTAGSSTSSAELYDPVTGGWTEVGPMTRARWQHTATLLPNGKVLIVAGVVLTAGVGFEVIASTELYDPASGMWTAGGGLHVARYDQKSVRLSNGQVLVIGGFDGLNSISSTELYDPATGIWTNGGGLNALRDTPQATLLSSGKVLVTGGYDNNSSGSTYLASAELYDPAVGIWTTNGVMHDRRWQHTSTLLPDGRVLLTGGYGGNVFASTDLYDPGSMVTNAPLPQLSGPTLSNGVFRFVLSGAVGSNYVVQASSNLANWVPLLTNTIPAGGSTNLIAPGTANQSRQFYRAMP